MPRIVPEFPHNIMRKRVLRFEIQIAKANVSKRRKRFQKKQPVWSTLDGYVKKRWIIAYKYERSEFDYKVADFETDENAVWVPSHCLRPWNSNCEPGRQITDKEAGVTRAGREEEEVREDEEEKKREDEEGSHNTWHENLIDV